MKPASFSDMKKVQKKNLNEFNRWVTSIYKSGYNDGLGVGEMWYEDEVFDLLRSEKIGAERAHRIVDKLLGGPQNQ